MIIIGMTGSIGHGKTTLSQAFSKAEPKSINFESFLVISEVVSAWHKQTTHSPNPDNIDEVNQWVALLPNILTTVVHKDIDQNSLQFSAKDIKSDPELYDKLFTHIKAIVKNPGLLNTPITPENKPMFRPILQWLGGYLVTRVDPGIWYKEIMRRAKQAETEGIKLCTVGGLRFPTDAEIIRSGGGYVIHIQRPAISDLDITDPTERERNDIKADTLVINDAGLNEVTTCAQRILNDIESGKIQTKYVASHM